MKKRTIGRIKKDKDSQENGLQKYTIKKSEYPKKVKPYLEQIKNALIAGVSVRELCKMLKIQTATWYAYLHSEIELYKTVQRAEIIRDNEIQEALEKRSKGYEIEEKNYNYIADEKTGKRKKTLVKSTTKFILPSVEAIAHYHKMQYAKNCPPFLLDEILEQAKKENWDSFKTLEVFEKNGYRPPQSLLLKIQKDIEVEKAKAMNGLAVIPATLEPEKWEDYYKNEQAIKLAKHIN